MDLSLLDLDSGQREFAEEVRAFFAEHVTEEVLEQERLTGNGFNEGVHLAMGKKGWIMPAWPPLRGGAGLDPVRLRILELESRRSQVPWVTLVTTQLVETAVEKYADPDLAEEILPKVAAG